jgi:ABC-type antimicrobial peptide transport system permease subunit
MNIIGLSIGLACSLLILLWVTDEFSFDRFHTNAKRIYRIEEDQYYGSGIFHVNVTPWPSGPVWKEKIPEIEQSCRLAYAGSFLLRRNDRSFYEGSIMAVDSTFFKIFSFELLSGDPENVLKEPGSIVISSEMAIKYFEGEDPVGKAIQVNNNEVFQVTGVMKKMPSNSTIILDFVIPFDYMKKTNWYSDDWGTNSINTFVMLRDNSDPGPVESKLTQIVREHNPGSTIDFKMDPFNRLHLFSYSGYGSKGSGRLNIWIFSSIAILVLIIACINFMNLSTARSGSRAREISLRKVVGAHRKNLIHQFFGESLIMALMAMVIAFIIVLMLLGPFNHISGKNFQIKDVINSGFVFGTLFITLLTGILAGSYPAVVLSAFSPLQTLKGTLSLGSKGGLFRKVTVIIQFTLSIVLVAGMIVMFLQLRHMQKQKLGYDKENLLYMQLRGDMKKAYPMIKEELLREPVVKSITASLEGPQQISSNSGGAQWEGKSPDLNVLVSMSAVDFDYVETMGIEMKSGRTFSKAYSVDTPHDTLASFLINEQMEKLMGMDDVVGAQLRFGSVGPVVGVMKDFNFQSLRSKIQPLAISIWGNDYLNFMYIRINPGNLTTTMKQLEKAWKNIMPLYPFECHFVDEDFDQMYRVELRMGTLINYFSFLAVLIACIGLFGLSTYTVEQKTREVGIRKALGASSGSIFQIFTREFVQLLVISAVISFPAAWLLLSRFLRNYSYHIRLNAWIFIGSALITFIVAMLAISFQTFRAIKSNPAETLKHE